MGWVGCTIVARGAVAATGNWIDIDQTTIDDDRPTTRLRTKLLGRTSSCICTLWRIWLTVLAIAVHHALCNWFQWGRDQFLWRNQPIDSLQLSIYFIHYNADSVKAYLKSCWDSAKKKWTRCRRWRSPTAIIFSMPVPEMLLGRAGTWNKRLEYWPVAINSGANFRQMIPSGRLAIWVSYHQTKVLSW